ncbi:MAG: hypothetical protein AABX29_08705, partial [Nanoarchaeota archaeon]
MMKDKFKKSNKVIFCPMCKSTDISFDAKLEITYDVCRNCGYTSFGGNFPFKIIKMKDKLT